MTKDTWSLWYMLMIAETADEMHHNCSFYSSIKLIDASNISLVRWSYLRCITKFGRQYFDLIFVNSSGGWGSRMNNLWNSGLWTKINLGSFQTEALILSLSKFHVPVSACLQLTPSGNLGFFYFISFSVPRAFLQQDFSHKTKANSSETFFSTLYPNIFYSHD